MRMLILKIFTLLTVVLFVSTGNYLSLILVSMLGALIVSEKMNFTFICHQRPVYKFSKVYF